MSTMLPREIVHELDKHIIGQDKAKRAVAIALRNRWRRMQLEPELRAEVTPKNILMIGPTGVGKTEIARRLAKLVGAPFIKVEATKFTEVGYVGRDVDSIIRDLVDVAYKQIREKAVSTVQLQAQTAAEERILNALVPRQHAEQNFMSALLQEEPAEGNPEGSKVAPEDKKSAKKKPEQAAESAARQLFRQRLQQGKLDDKEIEIEIAAASVGVEIMAPPGMEEMTSQLQSMFQNISGERLRKRKLKVKDALKLIREEEAAKLINDEDLKKQTIQAVEQNGIVFIDEIDKVTRRSEQGGHGGDISREGVQRDLLPLVEGSTISTKYGMVKTNYILFIASGAFHLTKPSDLIPELQGRLPIRVELSALTTEDFVRILTEPDASLTKQYQALLATEEVKIEFKPNGIKRMAEIAWHVNERNENIGARRLHTVIERVVEPISYEADQHKRKKITIDARYVNERLDEFFKNENLSDYIL